MLNQLNFNTFSSPVSPPLCDCSSLRTLDKFSASKTTHPKYKNKTSQTKKAKTAGYVWATM